MVPCQRRRPVTSGAHGRSARRKDSHAAKFRHEAENSPANRIPPPCRNCAAILLVARAKAIRAALLPAYAIVRKTLHARLLT